MGKHTKRRDRSTPAPVAASVASSAASPGGEGTPAPAPRNAGWKVFVFALILGLVALGAYRNSFTGGWVMDNSMVLGEDPRIREFSRDNLHDIFTHGYWYPTFESDLYRPLTTLSYLLNYAVLDNGAQVEKVRQQYQAQNTPFDYSTLDDGAHLTGYHVVNFLLHWANIVLVLMIVRRLSGSLGLAALAAGIFAVHPINVEAVTNIVGRADLLATLSILLGGWCYIKAAGATGGWRVAWLAGAGLNALWGVFAKESAILICLFVFLYDMIWRWPALPGPTFGQRLRQAFVQFFLKGWVAVLLPALILIGVYFYWQLHSPVFGEIFADNPIAKADSFFQGRMTAIKVLGRYLALLVYPGTLSSDYSYNQIPLYGLGGSWENAQCWLALVVVAALLGLAFWVRRTRPLLAWGILMIFLMQILTANLLFPIGTIMAERTQYLPAVGYSVVAALFLAQLMSWMGAALSRWKIDGRAAQIVAAGVLGGLLLGALATRTTIRNQDWQDKFSLWKSMVAASPNSFKAYKGYANILWQEIQAKHTGDIKLEMQTLDQVIQLAEHGLSILDNPPLPLNKQDNTLYQDLGDDYRLKGQYLEQLGKPEEARQYYLKSLAVLLRARDVDHWVNLTSQETQRKRGRPENEIHDVGNFNIYVRLSLTYEKLGDPKNAEAAANYVVLLAPETTMGYRLVAMAYDQQGRTGDAVVEILQGLLLNMHEGGCWGDLKNFYQKLGVQPFPLTIQPESNTYQIHDEIPIVRDEINHAGVQLVKRIEEAKLFNDALIMKDTLITKMGVPAQMFDQK